MKYAFIEAEKAFPVTMLCKMLQVSRSGFYDWRTRLTSRQSIDDQRLLAEIRAVFKESRGNYGSPRVHAELRARGWRVSRKRVERLMRDNGIQARRKRRFRKTTNSKHKRPVAPNVLDRKFDVATPNTVWAGDVTYIWTLQGWMYLAVVLDLFSRRVIGWSMSNQNDTKLALDAMKMAIARRQPAAGM